MEKENQIEKNTEKSTFVCQGCRCKVPNDFSVKTNGYCYLCDPEVTLEECLQDEYPKSWLKMGKKLSDLYVVVKTDNLLYTDSVYDFKTADTVCSTAKDNGYPNAEIITLLYALRHGYVF
jgi:hypothetical protein